MICPVVKFNMISSFRAITVMCATKYLNKLQHFAKYLEKLFSMQNSSKSFPSSQKLWGSHLDGLAHMNTLYFYKSFLRKVRSHLGKPVRLTGPAHLHMNSLLVLIIILSLKYPNKNNIFFCFFLKCLSEYFFKNAAIYCNTGVKFMI